MMMTSSSLIGSTRKKMGQNNTLEQAVLWAMALYEKKAHVEHVQVVVQAVEDSEEVVKKHSTKTCQTVR